YQPLCVKNDPIFVARSFDRDQIFKHVGAHLVRIAFERIAPPAAPAGPDDHFGLRRHRTAGTERRLKIILATELHHIDAVLRVAPTAQAPGWTLGAARIVEVPTAFDEIAYLHVESKATAEFSSASRVGAQFALFDQHRTLELNRLDRTIAHVALAHR